MLDASDGSLSLSHRDIDDDLFDLNAFSDCACSRTHQPTNWRAEVIDPSPPTPIWNRERGDYGRWLIYHSRDNHSTEPLNAQQNTCSGTVIRGWLISHSSPRSQTHTHTQPDTIIICRHGRLLVVPGETHTRFANSLSALSRRRLTAEWPLKAEWHN